MYFLDFLYIFFRSLLLAVAAFAFLIGPAVSRERPEMGNDTLQYSNAIFESNLMPNWTLLPSDAGTDMPVVIHPFFVVFGIIFPSITGVFAGVGMSGDLKNPAKVCTPFLVLKNVLKTSILGHSRWNNRRNFCFLFVILTILHYIRLHNATRFADFVNFARGYYCRIFNTF